MKRIARLLPASACVVERFHGSERRTLFYKYVPFGMHHGDACYDVSDPTLTDQQRSMLVRTVGF
jgi:hypothetical protein